MSLRVLSFASCLLVTAACVDDDDREACAIEAMVAVEIDPQAFDTLPVTDSVTLTGTVDSNIRLERLLVGELDAVGTRENFATWTATRTVQQLQDFRGAGGEALVPVVAVDVCGVEHPGESEDPLTIPVRVDAPANSDAPGLSVEVVASTLRAIDGAPECYLPADGTGTARVLVSASSEAAGVGVVLEAGVDGQFLGATDDRVVLSYEQTGCSSAVDEPCAASDEAVFRPTEAGLLGISVAAGRTFDLDETSGLRALEAPTFTGANGAVARNQSAFVQARSGGRLASCVATTSQADLVRVLRGSQSLLEGAVDLDDDAQCGQQESFEVVFDAMAPIGLTVDIACADTYGQVQQVSLSAGE